MIDTERVFAYRALRFARNDRTPLPGFEQDDFIAAANFDRRPWADLLQEFEAVRRSNLLMFRGLDEAAWARQGMASGNPMTVRAAAYVIAATSSTTSACCATNTASPSPPAASTRSAARIPRSSSRGPALRRSERARASTPGSWGTGTSRALRL